MSNATNVGTKCFLCKQVVRTHGINHQKLLCGCSRCPVCDKIIYGFNPSDIIEREKKNRTPGSLVLHKTRTPDKAYQDAGYCGMLQSKQPWCTV